MTKNSAIQWTHHTFNPWIGCSKVSPGCDRCYAENMAKRFGWAKWGAGEARRLSSDSYWRQPHQWNKQAGELGQRQRVFCASLADVFDNEVDDAWRARLWDLIAATPNLDWLLLTKRIGNVNKMVPRDWLFADTVPANVWLGITVVNQDEADRDIPKLYCTPPVKVKFLSMEPLLEPVIIPPAASFHIGWIIVGGESGGAHARALHPDTARFMRNQCTRMGIPFFFKQWGEWSPLSTTEGYQHLPFGHYIVPTPEHRGFGFIPCRSSSTGRQLDGREWNEFPGGAS